MTILIPVYEQLELTLECLVAVARTVEEPHCEVLVADDASADGSYEMLASIPGLRMHRRVHNGGFGANCNDAVAAARGRYLVFLNNDTEPQRGWLDAMLLPLITDQRVGVVGAKLIDQGGRLLEYGSVVWRDASAWNYGRGDDPAAAEYRCVRDTDYCSASALALRTSLFKQLEGFDLRFSPGYYEDADLAFRVRALGLRVVTQPAATVVHKEGGTFGSLPDHRRDGLIARNQIAFQQKWTDTLANHSPSGTARGWLGGRQNVAPRILLVERFMPAADKDAGGLRSTHIATALRRMGANLTHLNLWGPIRPVHTAQYEAAGIEVFYEEHFLEGLGYVRGPLYDMVIVTWPDVAARVHDRLRHNFPNAILVYDTIDVHHLRLALGAEFADAPAADAVEEMRTMELESTRRYDVTLAVSEIEASYLRAQVPEADVRCVPLVHDVHLGDASLAARAGILFVGGFRHLPNVDAMRWFLDAVWPEVRSRTDCRLIIVGADVPDSIRNQADGRVSIVGHVVDLDPYFAQARVFVSPIRYGGGIKGKNLQALAYGVPLVTTSAGAEGMHLIDGMHALLRDDPRSFAAAVVSIVEDDRQWKTLSRAGLELARARFAPKLLDDCLAQLVGDAIAISRRDGDPALEASSPGEWPHGPSHVSAVIHERLLAEAALNDDVRDDRRVWLRSLIRARTKRRSKIC